MSREEFTDWFRSLSQEQQEDVVFCLAEGVYGDDFTDEDGMAKLRQHIYEIFPDWHLA